MKTGHWINLGAGSNLLPAPWQNYDMDLDIRKPLPFPDNSVRFVNVEHCVEHQSPAEGYAFFLECRRVLQPEGVLRVTVPDVFRLSYLCDDRYLQWLGTSGFGEPTLESAVANLVRNHGHQSLWTAQLLVAVLRSIGLKATEAQTGVSGYTELFGIEGHHRVIGVHPNFCESTTVEAVKP